MKTIAYVRVSTEKQGDSGAGLSAQENACRGSATLDAVYQDVASGASGLEERPGLLKAISELGKGDVLIVAKRDRLGRDPFVLAMIEASITRKGATLKSADGVGNGDAPSDIFMKRIMDAISEYERLIIKARTTAALQAKKAKNERVGRIPFGYKLAEDGKHLIECENEQATIQLILQLKKTGMSLQAIANHLTSIGNIKREGTVWNKVNLHELIKKAA